MTAFTRVWNATYLSLPEDDDDALEGASRIRHTRVDVKERLEVDHYWAGDIHDGKHRKVTFRPIPDPVLDQLDEVAIYAKTVGTSPELFFKPKGAGSPIQLTFTGGEPSAIPAGTVIAYSGTGAIPGGFLECNGQAVSRTTYAGLWAAVGTTYGGGDGVNTFNVPDIKGRTIFGLESVATRLTAGGSGMNGAVLGAVGGSQSSQQHTHGATASGGGHSHGGVYHSSTFVSWQADGNTAGGSWKAPGGGAGAGSTDGATPSISVAIADYGSGNSGNVPPGIILKWLIKT